MPEPTTDKHYEEEFEFTLWKMIQQRATEKDISYRKAADEVVSEYKKTIRYRDTEFETKHIQNRIKEMTELRKAEQSGKTV